MELQNFKNYHYIRYGIFFAWMASLFAIPSLLDRGIGQLEVRVLACALTILCIVSDWRNYYLWRLQSESIGVGPVTLCVSAIYVMVFCWLIFTRQIPTARLERIVDLESKQGEMESQIKELLASNTLYQKRATELNTSLKDLEDRLSVGRKIEELQGLHNRGVITQDEFDKKKGELMGRY